MDKVSATVTILERRYKLTIDSSDEEYLRKAADLIDSMAKNYGKMYAYKDHQDLLAMVAITQITQLVQTQERLKYKETVLEDKMIQIEQLLEQSLSPSSNNNTKQLSNAFGDN